MDKIAHEIDEKERTNDVKLKENVPFQKMILKHSVLKGLDQSGFVYPTIVQANAIPLGKSGIDLLIQSKSGTGKTLIFCTILLESYNYDILEPQALILVPTREIAVQIEQILNKLGRFTQGFRAVSVIGGLDVMNDRKKIQGAKAIVGTPGRVLHLIKNEMLNTSKMNLLILDEADKMMTQSFQLDFSEIQGHLSPKKQIICTSATFCNSLDKKLVKFMKNPLLISTDQRATLLIGIKQFIYEIPEEKTNILEMQAKLKALKKIFSKVSFKQCLIFSSSQSRAESYRNMLNKDNWPCEVISGAQDQRTRLEIFKIFQNFETRILIATDLMSRGIDSENVNLVINLELPDDGATYLHRIGRSGRFGSHGIAITLCASQKEHIRFTNLLDKIGSGMKVLKFPQSEDTDKTIDLWDFSDSENEVKLLGVLNDYSEKFSMLNITKDSNKENVNGNVMKLELDNNIKVEANTYKIEYEHNANANKILLTETMSSLKQPSSSSNTIDDASSIAADSDILRSNSSFYKQIPLKHPSPAMSLLDILIDDSKSSSLNKKCDLFDDYHNTLIDNSESVNKQPDWKNLLIDNNIGKKFDKKLKDVFEEYEKNSKNNLDEEDSQQTETINSQEPTTSNHQSKYIKLNIQNDSQALESFEQKQHFPSPCPIKSNLNINNNLESLSDSDGGNSSTLTYSPYFASSSGFDEHTSSEQSSGIQTSSQSSNNNSSENNESDIYSNTEEYDETESNCNDEYSESDSEPDDESYQNELNSECNASTISAVNDFNYLYQNAYARWTALYWNQITQIQDYAKFSSYVKNNDI